MIINHNIAALNTHRQLGANNLGASKSLEKLSSGLRINRAGDDAAGLAISEKMRGQIRGLNMAAKNAQDGISLIQTAEGALNETHSILQRMRELAVQSANDTNTIEDREELQKEINQLTSEINRIANTTEFNTQKLLNGNLSASYVTDPGSSTPGEIVNVLLATTQTIEVGDSAVTWTNDSKADFALSFLGTADNGFDWTNLDVNETNELVLERTTDGFLLTFAGDDGAASLEIDAVALAHDVVNNVYTYDAQGISISIDANDIAGWAEGDTFTLDLAKLDNGSGNATTQAVVTNPDVQSFTTNTVADPVNDTGAAITNFAVDGDSAELLAGATQIVVGWDSGTEELTVDFQDSDGTSISSTTMSWDGSAAITYAGHGVSFVLDANDATDIAGTFTLQAEERAIEASATVVVPPTTEDRSLTFQIGANQNQTMTLAIEDVGAAALGLVGTGANFSAENNVTDGTNNTLAFSALDITTQAGASNAIKVINDAVNQVSSERSKLGAVQNRLEHTINNLGASAENLTAAESRIRDVDMAKEMMEFTKNNILTQAAQAMLAQANQQPQGVLQLLR